ncbi:MAG: 50S ribosomal protein L1 [Planctomycetes bacterium]|nr:50S ribosomal protein L1 [Planctomycetota bacterium]
MAKRSRRYQEACAQIDKSAVYPVGEAIDILKSIRSAQFDETVELHVQLGIDPRQSDQQIRTSLSLPNGTGRSLKVAVFADGNNAEKALEAGAEEVGSDELIERVEDGWMDFDVALATPSMMSKIGRLGRYLGPQGLMPTPKNGTVREDIGEAVKEFKAGKVELRNDEGANIHTPVGKMSFSKEELMENVQTVLEHLLQKRPTGLKGRFFRNVVLSSTMSPGIKVQI